MLRRFKGGAVVACDVPGCPNTFRSFSRAALVRGQASLDKWTHRAPTKLERDAVGDGRPLVIDRCPAHDAAVEPAPVLAVVAPVAVVPVAVESTEPAAVVPRKRRARGEAPAVAVPKERKRRVPMALPGTLVLVAEILRAAGVILSVREIVERAGDRLPSKSKTPATVVSRDLALAIKHGGESSIFVRTAPGRFTLRELAPASEPRSSDEASSPSQRLTSDEGVAA